MPLEQGGRADKFGNRYEIRCIIYELLKVIREDNYSVTIESLSDDEEGTDVLVCKKMELLSISNVKLEMQVESTGPFQT